MWKNGKSFAQSQYKIRQLPHDERSTRKSEEIYDDMQFSQLRIIFAV